MKKKLPLILRIILALLLVVVLIAGSYVAYVFIDYHRIDDNQALDVLPGAPADAAVAPGVTYTALTYNTGFGAYTPDYSFFMDGGESSWAVSPESVRRTVGGAAALCASCQPDFVLLQEVDFNATRTYHIDEKPIFDAALPGCSAVKAINYDSPFLFFPFTQPHGKSLAGLLTYSAYPIRSGLRRSLPISTGLDKILDLDRAYSVSRVPMTDGRELVLYNIHMTAYSNDDSIRKSQLTMLVSDMEREIAMGNPTVCGGDFNMEMMQTVTGEDMAMWARPLDHALLGAQVTDAWDLLTPEQQAAQPNSCRDAGVTYTSATETWMLDCFLISGDIEVEELRCIDAGYEWSDHNPILLRFRIK